MKRNNLTPILFIIALLVLLSIACGGSDVSGQQRKANVAMITGETASHALDRWEAANSDCDLERHAIYETRVARWVTVWYTCDVDREGEEND